MVILFFIALFLAWPTSGISMLLYIGLFIVKAILQAKARMHHVDKIRAQREVRAGTTRFPSWMASREKIEEFVYGAQSLAEHHGVPRLFSAMTMSNEEVQKQFMHYAGAMEAQGASFAEQQFAIAEKLVELHNK